MRLIEIKLQDISISTITNNALNKRYSDGNSGLWLKSVALNYPNYLVLIFNAEPTYMDDTKVGPSGQETHTKDDYESIIKFNNIQKDITSDFLGLPYSQQKMQLENLFENNDEVKLSCNCGAYYWQGMSHDHSKTPRPNLALYPWMGAGDTGIWRSRHEKLDTRACKHIYQCITELFDFVPEILKQLNKGSVSMGAVTNQPVNDIQKPNTPAGQPEKQKDIKTEKVDVEENRAEVPESEPKTTLTKEETAGHSPSGETTQVKAKVIEPKTNASKGISEEEPAIEEPEITEPGRDHTEEIEEKEDEDLEPIKESLESNQENIIYRLSDLFSELVDTIGKIAPVHLQSVNEIKESFIGDKRYTEAIKICQKIKNAIDELRRKTEEGVEIDPISAKHLALDIIELHTPAIIHILSRTFKYPEFDENDKTKVHRACQMYDYLVGMYKHELNQYNLKHVTRRLDAPEKPQIRTIKGYSITPEEIEDNIRQLKEKILKSNLFENLLRIRYRKN